MLRITAPMPFPQTEAGCKRLEHSDVDLKGSPLCNSCHYFLHVPRTETFEMYVVVRSLRLLNNSLYALMQM